MSNARFRGLLDGPDLFESLETRTSAVDPQKLEAQTAHPCPTCKWLAVQETCEQCDTPLETAHPL